MRRVLIGALALVLVSFCRSNPAVASYATDQQGLPTFYFLVPSPPVGPGSAQVGLSSVAAGGSGNLTCSTTLGAVTCDLSTNVSIAGTLGVVGTTTLSGGNLNITAGSVTLSATTGGAGSLATGGTACGSLDPCSASVLIGGGGHLVQHVDGGFGGACTITSGTAACSLDLAKPYISLGRCIATPQSLGVPVTDGLYCGEANTTSSTTANSGTTTGITLSSVTTFNTVGTQELCVDTGASEDCVNGTFSGSVFTPSVNWSHTHSGTYTVLGARFNVNIDSSTALGNVTIAVLTFGDPN